MTTHDHPHAVHVDAMIWVSPEAVITAEIYKGFAAARVRGGGAEFLVAPPGGGGATADLTILRDFFRSGLVACERAMADERDRERDSES